MQPDWTLLQSFDAVANHGSLSAAARALKISQPTLSRHISALEQHIGARLFERGSAGMTLTQAGHDLAPHASAMADAAAALVPDAPRSDPLAGTVRVTASQVVAHFTLPPILAALRQSYPQISIELVASDTSENLLRREADIAIRMYRPNQDDVITRHVADLLLGAYASRDYIARRGTPTTLSDVPHHDLIGYDRNPMILDGYRARGVPLTREDFALRCDDQVVCWQLVLAGCGIGFNQCAIGDADTRVERLFGPDPVAVLPMWLSAHADLRRSARVSCIYDALADALTHRYPAKKAEHSSPPTSGRRH